LPAGAFTVGDSSVRLRSCCMCECTICPPPTCCDCISLFVAARVLLFFLYIHYLVSLLPRVVTAPIRVAPTRFQTTIHESTFPFPSPPFTCQPFPQTPSSPSFARQIRTHCHYRQTSLVQEALIRAPPPEDLKVQISHHLAPSPATPNYFPSTPTTVEQSQTQLNPTSATANGPHRTIGE
jgi:hypothetical protein